MRLLIVTVLFLTSLAVDAAVPYAERTDAVSQSRFQLSFQSEPVVQNATSSNSSNTISQSETQLTESVGASHFIGNLKRYDATWLYPVTQSERMNIDLGVNLRYFDGQVSVDSNEGRVLHNYRAAIPMFYASALFDLPFKGLSARVGGGSQINVNWDQLFTSFDYKAALRYDWANGLGLEGGWQHRQWQLDNLGSDNNRIESKGLFLDLKFKF